ncbi:tyrosine-type recombinase/integrase [Halobacillus salinarum]|uniref:Tyrosine-type recombinase/integrase n=1 Tax=Halobacillus salinarum TaxID=2932257 RepID=A0ABY4EH55_9BACI|nr:site-specific integrase [Halobacillus salinarum]UOQ43777.1 tyrosine-type recombinase/integrase [Halobacillus salinarum]
MKGSVKKDGSTWYYVVSLGKKPNGRLNQKKKRGFKTKREATQALNEVIAQYNKGLYIEPSKMLYKEFLTLWLDDKKMNVQTSTFESYRLLVDVHISPFLGHIGLSKLNPMMINNFYSFLSNEKGLSGTTIQRIHTLVKDSLKKTVEWELLIKNPTENIKRPKASKNEVTVWTIDQVHKFLNVAESDPLFMAFHLAIATGMRQGEILGVRWTDLDWDKKLIMIRQTLSHDGKELKSGAKSKSGKRTITLPDETIHLLKKHKGKMDNSRSLIEDIYNDHNLIVCTELGSPINPSNLTRTFKRLTDKANLNKIRFHDLRHTHATILLLQNVNPKVVSERLGHSDVRLTLDTYSHLLPNMQREAADKIHEALFN